MQTVEAIYQVLTNRMNTAGSPPKSPTRARLLLFLAAACLCGMHCPAKAGWCLGVGYPHPSVVVFENESLARFAVYRNGDTNVAQTVDFRTTGGNPGVDYVPSQGTVAFAAGQRHAVVEIPLLDNGLLDGTRNFAIQLTNAPPGLVFPGDGWGQIVDNELAPTADPLFIREQDLALHGQDISSPACRAAGFSWLGTERDE